MNFVFRFLFKRIIQQEINAALERYKVALYEQLHFWLHDEQDVRNCCLGVDAAYFWNENLARCCKSCGGLLEPGEVCECLAFTEKERKDQEK